MPLQPLDSDLRPAVLPPLLVLAGAVVMLTLSGQTPSAWGSATLPGAAPAGLLQPQRLPLLQLWQLPLRATLIRLARRRGQAQQGCQAATMTMLMMMTRTQASAPPGLVLAE